MNIERLTALTPEQEAEIRALGHICGMGEGSVFLSNELNFNRSIPAFYLGREEGRLVSFLTLFLLTRQEAEVTAFTHPDVCRKGCFRALCQSARAVCEAAAIPALLFVVNAKSDSGKAALTAFPGQEYGFSEYRMELEGLPALNTPDGMDFVEVSIESGDLYRQILPLALEMEEENESYVRSVLENPLRSGVVACFEGRPVGVYQSTTEEGEACIHGVGLLPALRGRGLGEAMLRRACHQGAARCPLVTLEVDSQNNTAFCLYKKLGFQITRQIDYHRLTL